MRSGSLLGILLELLEELDAPGPYPADARVGRFFRARRFLGARDRRVISGLAYGWLRHRFRGEARWIAWAARTGLGAAGAPGGREGRLAALLPLARDGLLPWSLEETVTAARDHLRTAPSAWASLLDRVSEPDALGPEDWPADPAARFAAELGLPEWMAGRLSAERGGDAARRLASALLAEAPTDLRVNLSRVSREAARAALERELGPGTAAPTPSSPLGLRLSRRTNLSAFMGRHPGWLEVQDEGSQLLALALDPAPADTVIDACAGAGGKTLALLDLRDARGGAGAVHACEVLPGKLEELRRRAGPEERRGLVLHPLSPEGPLPEGLPGAADLVLVDAPCSGTGTLRRSPELKHRYRPEDLARFAALQLAILRRFAPRVRPGGRLVYATCSLFEEENGAVVESFLREEREFREVGSRWAAEHLPADALAGQRLRLDPVASGTDGYFAAFLERAGR